MQKQTNETIIFKTIEEYSYDLYFTISTFGHSTIFHFGPFRKLYKQMLFWTSPTLTVLYPQLVDAVILSG